jgi:hypothetical protein
LLFRVGFVLVGVPFECHSSDYMPVAE